MCRWQDLVGTAYSLLLERLLLVRPAGIEPATLSLEG